MNTAIELFINNDYTKSYEILCNLSDSHLQKYYYMSKINHIMEEYDLFIINCRKGLIFNCGKCAFLLGCYYKDLFFLKKTNYYYNEAMRVFKIGNSMNNLGCKSYLLSLSYYKNNT